MGHQIYVLLCTETALSNHPAVIPKSSCDVHLLRSQSLAKAMLAGKKLEKIGVRTCLFGPLECTPKQNYMLKYTLQKNNYDF